MRLDINICTAWVVFHRVTDRTYIFCGARASRRGALALAKSLATENPEPAQYWVCEQTNIITNEVGK